MHDPSDPEAAALFDFLVEHAEDIDAGRRHSLAHYLARHGHEAAIAREWLRLHGALQAPVSGAAGVHETGAADGERLGPYRLLEELGRGGQGSVWLARDERLGRVVALKRIEGGLGAASQERRERLRREAELIARLDHPGLCRVLEVELESPTPWIAMQHVPGESLARLLERAREERDGRTAAGRGTGAGEPREDEQALALPVPPRDPLALRRVLAYFERAARALHAAHEAGVIHRDVKPANLMVTAEGLPVVLDFGLARTEREHDGLTRPGDVFGTPAAMSPEQLAGDPAALDRRTDVYSLGVALHEALTLQPPFDAPTVHLLAERVRRAPPPDPRAANPHLPAEVATVLAVALEKDRERRYASALELAEDLRRIREYEPIRARPAPWSLRFLRWTQRHPVLAVLLVALSVSLALSVWQGARERRALRFALGRHLAERSRVLVGEDQAAALALGIEACELAPGHQTSSALFDALEACRIEHVLDGGSRRVTACALVGADQRPGGPDARARRAALPGESAGIAATRLALAGQEDGRLILWDLAQGRMLCETQAHEGGVLAVVAAPAEGARPFAWSVGADRSLRGWRRERAGLRLASSLRLDGAPLALALAVENARERDLALAGGARAEDDGRRVAVLLEGGRVLRVDLGLGVPDGEARVDPEVGALAFLGDGLLLLGPARPQRPSRAFAWPAPDGEPRALAPGPVVLALPSPAGDEVLLAGADGIVRFRDAKGAPTRAELALGAPLGAAAWSPDGSALALAAGSEGQARIRVLTLARRGTDAGAPAERLVLDPHDGRPVVHLAFSPDGACLASASSDLTVRVSELGAGRETARAKSAYLPEEVRWTEDGERLFARCNAPVLQVLFPAERPDLYALEGHRSAVTTLAFAPDGSRLLSVSADGSARLWSTPCDAAGGLLAALVEHHAPLAGAAFSADGERILTFGRDGRATVHDGRSGAPLAELAHDEPLTSALLVAGGARVLTLAASGALRCWEGERERWRREAERDDALLCVALDPHAPDRAWCGTRRGRVLALSLADGSATEVHALATPVRELVPGPDASRLVLSCGDASLRFLPTRPGPPLREALMQFPLGQLTASADRGLLLAIGLSRPGQALTLDLRSGTALRPSEHQQSDLLVAAALSADGGLAVTASRDGSLHLWEPRTARPVLLRDARVGPLSAVALGPSPRGWRVAAGGRDGRLRVLPVDPLPAARARRPRELRQWERSREQRLALPLIWR